MNAAAIIPAEVQIELAWPCKQLSPNTGVHFMTRHRFKKAAKDTAYWATKAALGRGKIEAEDVNVRIIAHPIKGKSKPDEDNLIASCKAFLDGIAKAVGVDDKHFRLQPITWAEPEPRGRIVVVLS